MSWMSWALTSKVYILLYIFLAFRFLWRIERHVRFLGSLRTVIICGRLKTPYSRTTCPKLGKIYAANKNPSTSIWDVTWTLPFLDTVNELAFSNRWATSDGSTSIQAVPNFNENQSGPCGERKIFSPARNQTLILLSSSSQPSHYKDWVIPVHGNSLFKAWISSLIQQKFKIISSKFGYFLAQFI
jgi:hypothetical protein